MRKVCNLNGDDVMLVIVVMLVVKVMMKMVVGC
jgi:hypothetical protein